ncbi:class I SAM-dependent methyltransferase [Nevskia soli]|uniref:class I SAM-dependent methyltransferase n=1 Tax=Nevskia soli TaxID=418856 RepID=UPI0012FC23B6|nr:class I SAM-dependent methyltransferase [Nevskia soli]
MNAYFKNLYQRTMREAYGAATAEIAASLRGGGNVLDCGANSGRMFDVLARDAGLVPERYFGIEWDPETAEKGRMRGLRIDCGDLNRPMPYESDAFSCVFGLSLLEHLLNGCRYMKECHRVLQPGGTLVLLTPNISTYFTAALILLGKMPSSGPHPDSDALVKREELFKVSNDQLQLDTERETSLHRHLVVFSYRVLLDYLKMIGFAEVRGHGFGLYPFPNFMQPMLERIDPWHCHQMVFIARK